MPTKKLYGLQWNKLAWLRMNKKKKNNNTNEWKYLSRRIIRAPPPPRKCDVYSVYRDIHKWLIPHVIQWQFVQDECFVQGTNHLASECSHKISMRLVSARTCDRYDDHAYTHKLCSFIVIAAFNVSEHKSTSFAITITISSTSSSSSNSIAIIHYEKRGNEIFGPQRHT